MSSVPKEVRIRRRWVGLVGLLGALCVGCVLFWRVIQSWPYNEIMANVLPKRNEFPPFYSQLTPPKVGWSWHLSPHGVNLVSPPKIVVMDYRSHYRSPYIIPAEYTRAPYWFGPVWCHRVTQESIYPIDDDHTTTNVWIFYCYLLQPSSFLRFGIFCGLVAIAIWWFRLRRRSKPGHCAQCGYDLRATPDRCPECGMSLKTAETIPIRPRGG